MTPAPNPTADAPEKWGDELDWCSKHGGYHLRNEGGGIAVITDREDAMAVAVLLNDAEAQLARQRELGDALADAADKLEGAMAMMEYPVEQQTLCDAVGAYRSQAPADEGEDDGSEPEE